MSESDPNGPHPLDYANPRHFPNPRWHWSTWLLLAIVLAIWVPIGFWVALKQMQSGVGYYSSGINIKSAANLRSIGQAIQMYAADNQGEYPDSLRTILATEDVTSGIFVSPLSNDSPADGPTTQAILDQLMTPGHCSYVYLGRGLTTKTVTSDMIIAYERPGNYRSGGTYVLFGDGHVEYVLGAQAATIAKRATTGPFPVTMPTTLPSN